jgi:hypothetical protein
MSEDPFIKTTTHHFKTHFAQFARYLQKHPEKAVLVHHYNKPIGLFVPYVQPQKKEKFLDDTER